MKPLEVAALIEIREFALRNIDNVFFKMSNEEVKLLRNKLSLLDKYILESIIKLDPNDLVEDGSKSKTKKIAESLKKDEITK
jgi:hypothetical protein